MIESRTWAQRPCWSASERAAHRQWLAQNRRLDRTWFAWLLISLAAAVGGALWSSTL
jgi:hypothetical protein